ncbi:MAG TPA: hypothetical protein VGY77_12280 [Gemmataceae bacterium]|nr:hypothetical protein [Gemmataceae bacterium]
MDNQMSQFKATAYAHMERDLAAGPKWVCTCEACHAIRSLVGVDKTLEVRQLVRQIIEVEERLEKELHPLQKRSLLGQYSNLYDKLADEMNK